MIYSYRRSSEIGSFVKINKYISVTFFARRGLVPDVTFPVTPPTFLLQRHRPVKACVFQQHRFVTFQINWGKQVINIIPHTLGFAITNMSKDSDYKICLAEIPYIVYTITYSFLRRKLLLGCCLATKIVQIFKLIISNLNYHNMNLWKQQNCKICIFKLTRTSEKCTFPPIKELSFCYLAIRPPSLSHVNCHGEESEILLSIDLFLEIITIVWQWSLKTYQIVHNTCIYLQIRM